ncbi:anthranilate synthase component I family protein [Desertivirga arenae]|uniref:anthranilate synthase component I family protein n=1 Tax=Desertivirga arenae TaxID=2810309 RepID=UPI001A9627E2|nr:anthranilate synthase component I family protein [Pedobacter sp. SYSU D00823]
MKIYNLSPEELLIFKKKAFQWAVSFETACYFDSNSYPDPYSSFDLLIAAGSVREIKSSSKNAFNRLSSFIKPCKWGIGFLGYDLKNDLEDLNSHNKDELQFPDLFFFEPKHLIKLQGNQVFLNSMDGDEVYKIINSQQITSVPVQESVSFELKSRFNYDEYCLTVEKVREHILRGDIYEMNLCQEFYSKGMEFHPEETYQKLKEISPTPFSCFFKFQGNYILSASPERFMCRRGSKLISQPIKGTAKRSYDEKEDFQLKEDLRNNQKEQSENVMIVDLVRNDLTKCSKAGSVKVEELFGIYTFRQVHQMISTIVSEAHPLLDNTEIIKAVFPMGSMTGAPKLRAMELIEAFERSKRGTFSGAIGYFSPEGDFDFNVVIRSVLYNSKTRYLSFQVGSAITYASKPEKEYEECLLKAEAILKALA